MFIRQVIVPTAAAMLALVGFFFWQDGNAVGSIVCGMIAVPLWFVYQSART